MSTDQAVRQRMLAAAARIVAVSAASFQAPLGVPVEPHKPGPDAAPAAPARRRWRRVRPAAAEPARLPPAGVDKLPAPRMDC